MNRTVTVSLRPHYEKVTMSSIQSGRYNNASEVIRAALRAALDEGEASPDVVDFNPSSFLHELKAERRNNG